jgi:O-antigen/teichoic acid export membrane protein
LAATLGALSLGGPILYHLGRRTARLEAFAGTCLAAAGGLGCATLAATLAVVWFGGEPLHHGIPWSLLLLALLPLPCLFAQNFCSSLLQGLLDIGWYNLVNHGAKMASLLAVIGLLSVGQLRVPELIVAGAALTAVTGGVAIWRVARHVAGPWRVDGRLFRCLIMDGLRVHLGGLAIFLANRANLLLANAYLPKAEVGYLYMALTLAELIWFVSIAAETVLYPRVVGMPEGEAAVLTAQVCRQVLFLSVVSGVALALLAPVAVWLYGGEAFLPAVTPLRLLLPGIVALTISKILSALWIRAGWFGMLTVLAGGTGLLSLALNLLFIPLMGTEGAALATTIPYVLNAVVSLAIYRFRVAADLGAVWRIRREDLTALGMTARNWLRAEGGPRFISTGRDS